MTSAPHPSYDNPTIQEAICELHFKLPEGVSWEASWYSKFYDTIRDQFSTFQPISLPVFMQVTQSLSGTTTFKVPVVIRYQHNERHILLQLFEERIVVNVLPEYPGWLQVREDIQYAWEKIRVVVNALSVHRVELRYINRIERSGAEEAPGAWLHPSDYIPPGVLQSQPDLLARTDAKIDGANRIVVTLAYQEGGGASHGAYILDIHRIVEVQEALNTERLLRTVDQLHEDIWEVFKSSMGERLERLLNGELP